MSPDRFAKSKFALLSPCKIFFQKNFKKTLDISTGNEYNINVVARSGSDMRVCWNRQTGTFEGRVSIDVWVQVPSLAPETATPKGVAVFCFIAK